MPLPIRQPPSPFQLEKLSENSRVPYICGDHLPVTQSLKGMKKSLSRKGRALIPIVMKDLGYEVDEQEAGECQINLLLALLVTQTETLPLGKDICRGTIYVVDDEGQIDGTPD